MGEEGRTWDKDLPHTVDLAFGPCRNDGSVVVSKLLRVAHPGKQLVMMTVDDLIYLLGGDPPCYDN